MFRSRSRGFAIIPMLGLLAVLAAFAVSLQALGAAPFVRSQAAQAAGATGGSGSGGTSGGSSGGSATGSQPEGSDKSECTADSPSGIAAPDGMTYKKVGKLCTPAAGVSSTQSAGSSNNTSDPQAKANCEAKDGIDAGTCIVRICDPGVTDYTKCKFLQYFGKEPAYIDQNLKNSPAAMTWDKIKDFCGDACKAPGSPAGSDWVGNAYSGPSVTCPDGSAPNPLTGGCGSGSMNPYPSASSLTCGEPGANPQTCVPANPGQPANPDNPYGDTKGVTTDQSGVPCQDANANKSECPAVYSNPSLMAAGYTCPSGYGVSNVTKQCVRICGANEVPASAGCIYPTGGPQTQPPPLSCTRCSVQSECGGNAVCSGGCCVPYSGGTTFNNPNGSGAGAAQQPGTQRTGGSSSLMNGLTSLLKGLAGFLGGSSSAAPQKAPAQACSTDPNAYAQQQQQYQQQLQQYNYQLQQYNYQVELNRYNATYYGTSAPLPTPPVQPTACIPSTSQQCSSQPSQPAASACSVGTWKPTYSGSCIVGWQCVPSTSTATTPTAQISCQPQIADAGMTLSVSYSCSAGTAVGSGFTASAQPSGSATTTIATPPPGANTATYTLTCDNQGKTAGAQCSVQVGRPSIILVADPKTVAKDGVSLLGWITSGIESCVISSPDQPDFTARNAANTSPNGTATTSPLSKTSVFTLRCESMAGSVREASTTVQLKN